MSRLGFEDLQRIYMLRSQGYGIREIGRRINRNHSVVSREFQRPRPAGFWSWDSWSRARYSWEQRLKLRRQPRRRLRISDVKLRRIIIGYLKRGLSPELISLRLEAKSERYRISHQAIYDWIEHDVPDLKRYLLRKGKRGRRGGKRRKGNYPQIEGKRSIEQRPEVINQRQRFGDWEGDTIVSSKSKPSILTLRERKSRILRLVKLQDCTSDSAYSAKVQALSPLPKELRRTLTLDNGPENSAHKKVEKRLRMQVYFCHPYSSWERGCVENGNGFVRRFLKKGTDFRDISRREIQEIEHRHNHRPMKVLRGLTPYEVFQHELDKFKKTN